MQGYTKSLKQKPQNDLSALDLGLYGNADIGC
jgi:hypothetical protein